MELLHQSGDDKHDYASLRQLRLQLERALPAPDFASAFAVALRSDNPQLFGCLDAGDDSEDDGDEVYGPSEGLRLLQEQPCLMSYLTPRMACKLFFYGLALSKQARVEGPGMCLPHLPSIARPCASNDQWWEAFLQCLQRILARISLGRAPNVNCNGEVVALCLLLDFCKAADDSGQDSHIQAKLQSLPLHRLDSDFDFIKDIALSDYDILLYDETGQRDDDSPLGKSCPNQSSEMMSCLSLATSGSEDEVLSRGRSLSSDSMTAVRDPLKHWFRPFDPECMYDHVS